jgi:D-glucosaminate-6-phosphate ammonia-lyase
MRNSLRRTAGSYLNRRDLFRQGGWLAAAGAFLGFTESPAAAAPVEGTSNIYTAIGVRPVINCKGTFTIISGSQSLPQVKRAMEEASRSYVHLDELMNGVGQRLAELTGAPWGIVTAGCAAAMTHCTAASIAGSNPERMQRLPDLTGMKNEVIIPGYSRNEYDHAIRMLGVKIVEVYDPSELADAFNERTAMVYILAGPGDDGPLGTEAVAKLAKQHNVPLLVDAAAEVLTFPNLHLQRGATAVAYSGGKCLRGPQCAGMLLGDKSLLQAAWLNSAPHHAFGRSLKVGKEEIMGMLAAVEAWKQRDHDAEWKAWHGWLEAIAARVEKVNGVTTKILPPEGLSNHTESLEIDWDGAKLGITGHEVSAFLLDTEPRIVFGGARGSRPDNMMSSILITPYMMIPGNELIAADRLYAVLSHPPKIETKKRSDQPPATLAGQWEVELTFTRGAAAHTLVFEQQANLLTGTHRGEVLTGDLTGRVDGNDVQFRSSQPIQGTRLSYDFKGTVSGDRMEGVVLLAEYGQASWTAQRHQYGSPDSGIVRPVKSRYGRTN